MINSKLNLIKLSSTLVFGVFFGAAIILIVLFARFEKNFSQKIYPGIYFEDQDLSGKTVTDINSFFAKKNEPLQNLELTLKASGNNVIVTGQELNAHFDSELTLAQAFSFGRTGSFLSDLFFKLRSFYVYQTNQKIIVISLTPVISYDSADIEENIYYLKEKVDVNPIDPLFEFEKNKVKAFRLGKSGQVLNFDETVKIIDEKIKQLALEPTNTLTIELPVTILEPKVAAKEETDLGITALLGSGYSLFSGSIAGRIHNVALASGILHGQLIAPDETFSFNKSVGDISAATGYKPAYVIKQGRTVLDDGGGVCQVSTTLFRAALNSGLPIVERAAHSYRVGYYEQGNFKPGVDATVFSPSTDFRFKNDTGHYILIQTKFLPAESKLIFELYGTSDGRKSEVFNFKLWDQKSPPPQLYQDDPTLPNGTEKQVDWPAWGAKASFDYKVTRGNEIIFQKTFTSNYLPWQAVYLRGTKQ